MAKNSSSSFRRTFAMTLVAATFAAAIVACLLLYRRCGADSIHDVQPQSNSVSIPTFSLAREVSELKGTTNIAPTEDDNAVLMMRKALDEGRELDALKCARSLMDSGVVDVRCAVLEVLGWIGKNALPEISEMLNDGEPTVCAEALHAWEMAYGELSSQRSQASAIEESVMKLRREDDINAILMHICEFDNNIALPLLSRIIENGKSSVVGECAREAYSHITGGCVYVSPEETAKFLKDENAVGSNTEYKK